MIQQQTRIIIADNTGAKLAECITVLGGSTARGKFTRRAAGLGDVTVCLLQTLLAIDDYNCNYAADDKGFDEIGGLPGLSFVGGYDEFGDEAVNESDDK